MSTVTAAPDVIARAVDDAADLYRRALNRGKGRRWDARIAPAEKARLLARSIKWNAPAASEYPWLILDDVAAVEQLAPDLAADAWHYAAGACCLCPCASPAWHRDAITELAGRLEALARGCAACTADPGEPCRPWCLALAD
jgi:hypothetical protein